jgi:SAM-dependent methyltransferase
MTKLFVLYVNNDYDFWKKFGFFGHGQMNEINYASATFAFFFETYEKVLKKDFSGISMLELGPGDSVANGVLAFQHGARHTVLVDVGDFVTRDTKFYSEFISGEKRKYASSVNFSKILADHNIDYYTAGLESLTKIPPNSIDLVISNAVLEHIHPKSLSAYLAKINQLLTPGGVMIHRIDYRDHLVRSNFHQGLPRFIVKSNFYKKSILYLNGFTEQQYSQLFIINGFSISIIDSKRFQKVHLKYNDKRGLDSSLLASQSIASSCFICVKNLEN